MSFVKLSVCVLIASCLYFAMSDAFNYDRTETFDTFSSDEDDFELDSFMVMMIASFAEQKLKDRLQLESRATGFLESIADQPNVKCGCKDLTCKCCHKLTIINVEGCVRLHYRPKTETAVADVTFNDNVVYEKEFNVTKPREFCFDVKAVKACLEFTKFHVTSTSFSGCIGLAIHVVGKKIATYDLGCFEFKFPKYSLPFPFAENRLEDFRNAMERDPGMNKEEIYMYDNDQDF